MNKDARSFVVIMIVIALVALALRFTIVQLMHFTIEQNEENARETLTLIATAIENYANAHEHVFPTSLATLVKTNPPYIKKEYINLYYTKGYSLGCNRLETSGYTCQASPLRCNVTGKNIFTVTTGVALTTEDCAKKE